MIILRSYYVKTILAPRKNVFKFAFLCDGSISRVPTINSLPLGLQMLQDVMESWYHVARHLFPLQSEASSEIETLMRTSM